jgi:hypothetical protein
MARSCKKRCARDPGPLVDNPAMKMNNWLTKGIGCQ